MNGPLRLPFQLRLEGLYALFFWVARKEYEERLKSQYLRASIKIRKDILYENLRDSKARFLHHLYRQGFKLSVGSFLDPQRKPSRSSGNIVHKAIHIQLRSV